MANIIEILTTARNNAAAALTEVKGQLLSLGVAAEAATPGLTGMLGPLGAIGAATAGLTGVAAGVAAVGVAAIAAGVAEVKMGVDLAETSRQLERQSEMTGLSVNQVQILRQALVNLGGSGDDLNRSMIFLGKNIALNNPILHELGITTKDTWQAYLQLADALGHMTDQNERALIATTLLGRGGFQNLAIFRELRGEVERVGEAMQASGGLFSPDTLGKADALHAKIDELRTNWQGLLNQLSAMSLPTAEAVIDQLDKVTGAIARAQAESKKPFLDQGMLGQTVTALGKITDTWDFITHAEERASAALEGWLGRFINAKGLVLGIARVMDPRAFTAPPGADQPVPPPPPAPPEITEADLQRQKKHEALVEELEFVKKIGQAEAERLAARLEEIELKKKSADIDAQLLGETKAHADEVKRIVELTGATTVEAERLLKKLEEIRKSTKAWKDLAALGLTESGPHIAEPVTAGESPAGTAMLPDQGVRQAEEHAAALTKAWDEFAAAQAKVTAGGRESAKMFQEIEAAAARLRSELHRLGEDPQATMDNLDDRLQAIKERLADHDVSAELNRWSDSLTHMLSPVALVHDGMTALVGGLEAGFSHLFASILAGGRGFAEGMKSLFKSLVDSIIKELERLAALAIVKFLLNLVAPGLGTGVGAGLSLADSSGGGGLIGPPAPSTRQVGSTGLAPGPGRSANELSAVASAPSSQAPSGYESTQPEYSTGGGGGSLRPAVHWHIHATDARSAVLDIMSGSLRRASDVLVMAES